MLMMVLTCRWLAPVSSSAVGAAGAGGAGLGGAGGYLGQGGVVPGAGGVVPGAGGAGVYPGAGGQCCAAHTVMHLLSYSHALKICSLPQNKLTAAFHSQFVTL